MRASRVRRGPPESRPPESRPRTGRETGIDVGLQVFLITADGEPVENPRQYRQAEKHLAKAQRRASRRTKGSKRRKKAGQLLARHQQEVQRQRTDFHHKTALNLLRTYDAISLEDLPVRTRVRNRHLAASISDAGWAAFRTILTSNAADAGKWLVAVSPAFTGQDCSGRGERVPKSLSVRTHVCPSCGLVLDRDEHAARNMLRAGQALQGAVAVAAALNREAPRFSRGEHVTCDEHSKTLHSGYLVAASGRGVVLWPARRLNACLGTRLGSSSSLSASST